MVSRTLRVVVFLVRPIRPKKYPGCMAYILVISCAGWTQGEQPKPEANVRPQRPHRVFRSSQGTAKSKTIPRKSTCNSRSVNMMSFPNFHLRTPSHTLRVRTTAGTGRVDRTYLDQVRRAGGVSS